MSAIDAGQRAWPFFEARHAAHAEQVEAFARTLPASHGGDLDASCRALVRAMGAAGVLEVAAPGGGDARLLDSRLLCLTRETLAWHDALADFCFAMQGLGTGAITLDGTPAQRAAVLPRVARGEWIAAFALSETQAGSDVAALSCRAARDTADWVLDGEKTWISNGGIADVYTVFARTGEEPYGTRGISAFVVYPDDPGFTIARRIDVMAPHPLATLHFEGCRIPADRLIGAEGQGFKLAMRTLDIFRASVAAAALGMGRRALHEATAYARTRRMLQGTLGDLQLTQAALGTAATELDAAALLTYRAAWQRDVAQRPTTREAAMAKLFATEAAQRAIDRAVQLFGGRGVEVGTVVERLYREIRALRIYEGATEVQQLIVGRDLLKEGTYA
ncbi:MAG: acyl-CoA dehydrogenase family protein [Gemmatimonadaceae bacterium]|jgi:acyl-CoA dehydrogenase|nr:acyl-CoA dehydrogenase family protein [Gemmatimonadaceae bacterium]